MKCLIAIATLTSGCALPEYPCEIHLRAEGFSEVQLNAIGHAVDGWTKVLGDDVVTLDASGDTTIALVDDAKYGSRAGNTILYPSGEVKIEVYLNTSDYLSMRYIAMHEIGHALGLDHVDFGVMQSPTPENLKILPTAEDAAPILQECK